jgi:hypothetical protein
VSVWVPARSDRLVLIAGHGLGDDDVEIVLSMAAKSLHQGRLDFTL